MCRPSCQARPTADGFLHPDGEEVFVSEEDVRPNPVILLAGSTAVAAISFMSMARPAALASTVLGMMIAGAEGDARTFLLPDTVTAGTFLSDLVAAAVLDPLVPGLAPAQAVACAVTKPVLPVKMRSNSASRSALRCAVGAQR